MGIVVSFHFIATTKFPNYNSFLNFQNASGSLAIQPQPYQLGEREKLCMKYWVLTIKGPSLALISEETNNTTVPPNLTSFPENRALILSLQTFHFHRSNATPWPATYDSKCTRAATTTNT